MLARPQTIASPCYANSSKSTRCDCCCTDCSLRGSFSWRARAGGWNLEELVAATGCGATCGLCRPYLRRMLATGEAEFRELLWEDPPR